MPPLWKIKRELIRIGKNVRVGVPRFGTYYFGARYYDLFLARKRRVVRGKQADAPQKAVYLIFPKDGVLPSHIRTLDYFAQKGVSVTIVSNLPLGAEDEAKLLELCHTYIERPNFGYDFGGYRDGILSLRDRFESTQKLVLINDSVWFPLRPDVDWLAEVDALNVDFAGCVSAYGFNRVRITNYHKMTHRFDYSTERGRFHYCSFALCFGENILKSREFPKFWKRFPMTSNKVWTIRRGEMGLTAWVLKHGFSHGDTLGVSTVQARLEALDRARLLEIMEGTIYTEDTRYRTLKDQMMARSADLTKREIVDFIMTSVALYGAGYAMSEFAAFELRHPFLKKLPILMGPADGALALRILEGINTPASLEALEEAKTIIANVAEKKWADDAKEAAKARAKKAKAAEAA